tara:strand:- start:375 stop:563 length:189 start_codon:yes stop_codon:yes gene_type:complete
MLDFYNKTMVTSSMESGKKDRFNIKFPESMTEEKVEWIKEYVFKFLERNACEVIKEDNGKKK